MIKIFDTEKGVAFIDFTGRLRRNGKKTKSESLLEARIVNFYSNDKLVGSLAYEIYSKADFLADGPYFTNSGNGSVLIHTVFVRPKYRGRGIMRDLFGVVKRECKPVYMSFCNESLGRYFDKFKVNHERV